MFATKCFQRAAMCRGAAVRAATCGAAVPPLRMRMGGACSAMFDAAARFNSRAFSSTAPVEPSHDTKGSLTLEQVQKLNPGCSGIMSTPGATPVIEALRETQREANKALLVTNDDGYVVGVFSESDVMFGNASEKPLEELTVADVMSAPVVTSSRKTSFTRGLELLVHRDFHHLPILTDAGESDVASVDDGKVPLEFYDAVVTKRQLVKALCHAIRELEECGVEAGDVYNTNMNLRDLLKKQRKENTLTCIVNTGVDDDCTVDEVLQAMVDNNVRSVLVVGDDDALVGLVTSHDVIRRVLLEGRDPAQVQATAIMTKDPKTVQASDNLLQATRHMLKSPYHHFPIVEGGSNIPVGVVSLADLVSALCPRLHDGKAPSLTRVQSVLSMLTARKPVDAAKAVAAAAMMAGDTGEARKTQQA